MNWPTGESKFVGTYITSLTNSDPNRYAAEMGYKSTPSLCLSYYNKLLDETQPCTSEHGVICPSTHINPGDWNAPYAMANGETIILSYKAAFGPTRQIVSEELGIWPGP